MFNRKVASIKNQSFTGSLHSLTFWESFQNTQESTRVTFSFKQYSVYVQPYQKRDPAHIFSCKLPENLEKFSEQLFFQKDSWRLLCPSWLRFHLWLAKRECIYQIYIIHGQARKCYRIAPELQSKFVQSNIKAPTIQFICL